MQKESKSPRMSTNDTPLAEIKSLSIHSTRSTPSVIFDPTSGIYRISGRSMPEDCKGFYQPIVDWTRRFTNVSDQKITVEFNLDYFSSSSSVFLLYIMQAFNEMNTSEESKVTFSWMYKLDDEALLEAGQEYAEIIGSSFLLESYR